MRTKWLYKNPFLHQTLNKHRDSIGCYVKNAVSKKTFLHTSETVNDLALHFPLKCASLN